MAHTPILGVAVVQSKPVWVEASAVVLALVVVVLVIVEVQVYTEVQVHQELIQLLVHLVIQD